MTPMTPMTISSNQCTIIARCQTCEWEKTFVWKSYFHGDHLAHARSQAGYHALVSDQREHPTTLETVECFDGPGIETTERLAQKETLAERSFALLQDPGLRRSEFERVMLWRRTLTPTGLGWKNPTDGRNRYQLPISEEEKRSYQNQRENLAHQLLTDQECQDSKQQDSKQQECPWDEHHGQISLALEYLTYCQSSETGKTQSDQAKIRAQKIGPPNFISNGAMITAALMVNARATKVQKGRVLEQNAHLYVKEPRLCGTARSEQTKGCWKNLIPAGSRKQLCDQCRGAGA